jgi:ABC-type multidrug transport system fused ATPase/permease subunit
MKYRLKEFLISSILFQSAKVLNKNDRYKVLAVTAVQITLSFADLLGVALTGVLGALAINGIQSKKPGNRVESLLRLMHIDTWNSKGQITFIAIFATLILIGRTVFSLYFSRRIVFFMGRKGVGITRNLLAKFLTLPFEQISSFSIQEIQFILGNGVEAITTGMLASGINFIADFALFLVISLGLFIVQPILAIQTLITFCLVGYILSISMKSKAKKLGLINSTTRVESSEKIVELFTNYREILVRNQRENYVREISYLRNNLADTISETSFLPSISKYVVEITLILGALIIGATQFALSDSSRAIATLTLFLAAGSRLAPAVLRLQQGYLSIRTNESAASKSLELIELLKNDLPISDQIKPFKIDYVGFEGSIVVRNVKKAYSPGESPVINGVSFTISPNSLNAIVGPSGAGKTTLIDLLLGVKEPTSGEILISNCIPRHAIELWPGAIAYVPQDVAIKNGSIKENILLGFSQLDFDDEEIWNVLDICQLKSLVGKLPGKLNSVVGERGSKLSGGQRQRLGIARSLITKPRLLILDESTSSLDVETEMAISESINILRGRSTVLMIAHRLSTVRKVDQLFYMEAGEIKASGTFDEVRSKVPNFDKQVKLMEL